MVHPGARGNGGDPRAQSIVGDSRRKLGPFGPDPLKVGVIRPDMVFGEVPIYAGIAGSGTLQDVISQQRHPLDHQVEQSLRPHLAICCQKAAQAGRAIDSRIKAKVRKIAIGGQRRKAVSGVGEIPQSRTRPDMIEVDDCHRSPVGKDHIVGSEVGVTDDFPLARVGVIPLPRKLAE